MTSNEQLALIRSEDLESEVRHILCGPAVRLGPLGRFERMTMREWRQEQAHRDDDQARMIEEDNWQVPHSPLNPEQPKRVRVGFWKALEFLFWCAFIASGLCMWVMIARAEGWL